MGLPMTAAGCMSAPPRRSRLPKRRWRAEGQERAMRVFTIPPDVGFLSALVNAILSGGFPAETTPAPGPADLCRWTVLVPTRRAARSLRETFLAHGEARLLPRISPTGDIDEDRIDPIDSRP